MSKINTAIRFCAIATLLFYGCKSHNSTKQVDEFALYTTVEVYDSLYESYKLSPSVQRLIPIPKSLPLEKKINILLDSISKNNFHNLEIETLSIEDNQEDHKSLKVNLKENPGFIMPDSLGNYLSWYEYFQGSTGGEQTTIILVESILQREYSGDWIDDLEFYYQNEKIGEWDHITLSGIIKR